MSSFTGLVRQGYAMPLPDAVRLPLSFDVAALTADLQRLAQPAWTDHFVRQNYDGNWSAIALRAPLGETHPIRQIACNSHGGAFVDTGYLKAAPYFRHVLDSFACPLLNVRLMRLTAGSRIKPHRDHDLDPEYGLARLHIPIVTNAGVEFTLAGSLVAMMPGECWSLRLSQEHSAVNRGASDRIHMVIDAQCDGWLMGQLTAGMQRYQFS